MNSESTDNRYVYVLTRSSGWMDFSDRPCYRHIDDDVFVAVFSDKTKAVRLCVDELGMRVVVNFEDHMEFELTQAFDSEHFSYRSESGSNDKYITRYKLFKCVIQ